MQEQEDQDLTGRAAAPASSALAAPGSRRIPAQMWDAAVEAGRWRDVAARDVKDLIASAESQAEELRAAAVERGRDEGLASATALLAAAALERDRTLVSAESALVDLAFDIAGRVLATLAASDRRVVEEVAARALEEARARGPVTIRAHEADLVTLREAVPRLVPRAGHGAALQLVPDASVARGGVVVETDNCRVDARLATQLEGLRRALEADEARSR